MIKGLVLVALGIGILLTAPAFARDAGAANRQSIFGERFGRLQTSADVVFGVVVGVVAIVAGLVWVIADIV